MRRTPLKILAVLLCIAPSAHSRAAPNPRGGPPARFHDAVDAFELPFAPSGASVCLIGSDTEAGASDCEGVPFARILSELDPGQEAAVVRRGQLVYVLTYTLAGHHSGWFWGVEKLAAESHPGSRIENKYANDLTTVHVGYAEVRRRDLVIHEAGSRREPVELVSYHIPGARGDHVLTVQAQASIATLARADVDKALSGLRVEVSPFAKLWVIFSAVFPWIVALGATLLALGVGAFVWMRRRRLPGVR